MLPVETIDAGITAGKEVIAEKKAATEVKREDYVAKQFEREHPDLASAEKVKADKEAKDKAAKAKMDSIVDSQVAEDKAKEVEAKVETKPAVEAEQKPPEEEHVEAEAKPEEVKTEDKAPVKPSLEDIMKTYAEKNGITLDEAKADFEANDGILKKYHDNPETFPYELAKAYRNQQVEYTKGKAHQQEVNANNFAQQIIADPKGFINRALEINKDKLLKDFRASNPERSAILTDGAILEELREKGIANLNIEIQKYQGKMQRDSSQKREGLMASLKDADKPYVAEIKSMLYKLPDSQVADPTFNFKDLVRWAKGDDVVISKMVKDAEDRGYQRAMQEKKILGDASVGKGAGNVIKKKSEVASGGTLTKYQQDKAVEMFGSAYDTREECYSAYDEVVLKRSKKK
jgi:hypothetical protein